MILHGKPPSPSLVCSLFHHYCIFILIFSIISVRVRPFTISEASRLIQTPDPQPFLGAASLNNNQQSRYNPNGLRKVINVVDDRMLIFDPPETNPMANIQRNAFPTSKNRIREHRFVFDKLFDEDVEQQEVYESTTKPLLDTVLEGFNSTVFAYGATGCGKTHTISGTQNDPGIIFRTMRELFEKIDDLRDTKTIDVSLSYLEIYNETIRDLLAPQFYDDIENNNDTNNNIKKTLLQLREDENKRISVTNLSSHKPKNVEQVMDMIFQGNSNRTVSPTAANATSSRSHAVLQINIDIKNRTVDISEEHTFATLSIIDLAGSERASATKNIGKRFMKVQILINLY